MAIRDVVTRGYGNGTYDPGVNKLPTRGYTISTAVVITGPYHVAAAAIFTAGAVAAGVFAAGQAASEVFTAGSASDEVN